MLRSEPFGLGMLTRQEGERLAQAINALRPDWPVRSLLTFIERRCTRPLLDLSLELMYVALDPDTKSPARIDGDGPWKRLQHTAKPGQAYRAPSSDDCAICHRPAGLHSPLASDPHEWEAPNARGRGVKSTPEQRAAREEAAQAALLVATGAREAAEEKKHVRDMADVLASHTTEENA